MVAKAFGSIPGDKKWNTVVDLNTGSIINVLDVYAVARDYGKTV